MEPHRSCVGNAQHLAGTVNGESLYDGGIEDGLRHGNGVLVWGDGRRYVGQFFCGSFHGSGEMSWPDGRKYSGQYHQGKKHGDGVFSWPDGRRYVGDWADGHRNGTGVYTNAKGRTRRGYWETDRPITWDPAPPSPAANGRNRAMSAPPLSPPSLLPDPGGITSADPLPQLP